MKILVISVHPDDETLGAGGSLLKYKFEGHSINWLNITNMEVGSKYTLKIVEEKAKMIQRVRSKYNSDFFEDLCLNPADLEIYPLGIIISEISRVINEVKPNILLIPYYGDVHSDHRVVFESIMAASKTFRYPFVKKILMMEVISETDYSPIEIFRLNYDIDISNYLNKKLEIMSIYNTEIEKHPFPRSLRNLEALAIRRGSQSNFEFAESFQVLKIIE